MNRGPAISPWEATREAIREIAALMLAAVLLIPAGVIWVIDRLTLWWIRRRGGLN